MGTISFRDAFNRWYDLSEAEHRRLLEAVKRKTPLLSWEALDHLCGLAVESGMKALMLHAGLEKADRSGDFPAGTDGRRPHVHELWDVFMAKASGRRTSDWITRLAGGAGSPVNVFKTWRTENRYAADGTLGSSEVEARMKLAKRLKSITQEEGL